MHCFERASLPREMSVAHAYFLREVARKVTSGSRAKSKARSEAFTKAANAFIECAAIAMSRRKDYFKNAGDCYEHGGDDRKAAKAYYDGEDFTRAAQLYRKVHMFDEAVEVIRAHQDRMDGTVVNQVRDVARLFYFKELRLE